MPLTDEERIALLAKRREALKHDVWACPACEFGWSQYLIQTDRFVCCHCGYQGGEPKPQEAV